MLARLGMVRVKEQRVLAEIVTHLIIGTCAHAQRD